MSAYRQSPFSNLTPVVKPLLIINIIFFIAFLFFDGTDTTREGPLTHLFGMHYFGSPSFRPWQIITYMFMHGGWAHIFFNMFALFSFGPIVEHSVGSKRFFNLYFICGIGAVILQLIVQAIQIHGITGSYIIHETGVATPYGIDQVYFQYGTSPDLAGKLYGIYNGPLVGASGAIFGLLVAFGMLYPNMELMILFLPIPINPVHGSAIKFIYDRNDLFGFFRRTILITLMFCYLQIQPGSLIRGEAIQRLVFCVGLCVQATVIKQFRYVFIYCRMHTPRIFEEQTLLV